jgi:hypothetical protein
MQSYFFSYGGVKACAGTCACDFQRMIGYLEQEVITDNARLTEQFYREVYMSFIIVLVLYFHIHYICRATGARPLKN